MRPIRHARDGPAMTRAGPCWVITTGAAAVSGPRHGTPLICRGAAARRTFAPHWATRSCIASLRIRSPRGRSGPDLQGCHDPDKAHALHSIKRHPALASRSSEVRPAEREQFGRMPALSCRQIFRGVPVRGTKPREVVAFQGWCVWCFGARAGAGVAVSAGSAAASAAALARTAAASALSFSRQQCLSCGPSRNQARCVRVVHGSERSLKRAVPVTPTYRVPVGIRGRGLHWNSKPDNPPSSNPQPLIPNPQPLSATCNPKRSKRSRARQERPCRTPTATRRRPRVRLQQHQACQCRDTADSSRRQPRHSTSAPSSSRGSRCRDEYPSGAHPLPWRQYVIKTQATAAVRRPRSLASADHASSDERSPPHSRCGASMAGESIAVWCSAHCAIATPGTEPDPPS